MQTSSEAEAGDEVGSAGSSLVPCRGVGSQLTSLGRGVPLGGKYFMEGQSQFKIFYPIFSLYRPLCPNLWFRKYDPQ